MRQEACFRAPYNPLPSLSQTQYRHLVAAKSMSISLHVLLARLPPDVLRLVVKFIPKPPPRPDPCNLQRMLEKFQKSPKRTAMDLYGLDDFVLN
jgi:hypothetical protein